MDVLESMITFWLIPHCRFSAERRTVVCSPVCSSVRVSTLMSISVYGRYVRNPSTYIILLLHMERTYIELCNKGLILIFLENWKKKRNLWKKSEFYKCWKKIIKKILIHVIRRNLRLEFFQVSNLSRRISKFEFQSFIVWRCCPAGILFKRWCACASFWVDGKRKLYGRLLLCIICDNQIMEMFINHSLYWLTIFPHRFSNFFFFLTEMFKSIDSALKSEISLFVPKCCYVTYNAIL